LKVNVLKKLAQQTKALPWTNVTKDLYHLDYHGYSFLKRKISLNYFQFTVTDTVSSCTFKMYEKELASSKTQ